MYPNEFELLRQHQKDLLQEAEIRHLARRLRSVHRKEEGGPSTAFVAAIRG